MPKGKMTDAASGAVHDDERRENISENEFAKNGKAQATEQPLGALRLRCFFTRSSYSGLSCTHTRDFKHWREQQINDDEIETNQLIIRLDRLISNAPRDPVDRKGQKCFFKHLMI